ncbi:MAG: DUF1127 domain-containing protein [Minwuiales bacterium]|nr:DUF1127 domain-containing protein [Minwuiales bacterium]
MMFGDPHSTLHQAKIVRETRRQLHTLSDGQLHDIGFTRDRIGDVAEAMTALQAPPPAARPVRKGFSLRPLFRAFVSP